MAKRKPSKLIKTPAQLVAQLPTDDPDALADNRIRLWLPGEYVLFLRQFGALGDTAGRGGVGSKVVRIALDLLAATLHVPANGTADSRAQVAAAALIHDLHAIGYRPNLTETRANLQVIGVGVGGVESDMGASSD